jgi:(p)ppGpp synthase/HD superfamily hydrolase
MSTPRPEFAARSELIDRAWRFASAAYAAETDGGAPGLAHPATTAALLVGVGAPDATVAAALLHDVLEDTAVSPAQLREALGPEVAGVVQALTEDDSIRDYEARKARLREQIAAAGEQAALVSLADKLARLRAMEASGEAPDPAKLAHYKATFALLSDAYPDLPLVADLRHALRNARRERPAR